MVGEARKVFLCLDFGTESVRGELISVDGTSFGGYSKEYHTYFPQNGWVEQNPGELWDALTTVCQKLGQIARESHYEIEALSIDSTACCLLFLDGNKNPLGNMIMWMDVRATNDQLKGLQLDTPALNYHIGQSLPSTWMPLRIQWMKEHDRRRFEDSSYVCELLDWLQYRLTGELVHSQNIATLKWYFNSEGVGWPTRLYEQLGISDLLGKVSSRILASGDAVGRMTRPVSNELGLSDQPLVVEGGADAFVGTLGLGIIDEGDIAVIGGSSHVMICNTRENLHLPGMFGSFPDALIPGHGLLEGSQTSSGSTLKWYVKNFLGPNPNMKELDLAASKIPAGSDGVMVLDHWQGNRSPFFDEKSRGVIRGLSLSHTPIHIFRAIMEGISLGTAVIADKLVENGYHINKMVFGGGVAKSRLWLQIHADALGLPVHVPAIDNAQLLGGAVLCSYACGYFDSKKEAVRGLKPTESVLTPIPGNVEMYLRLKEEYLKTYYSLYG